MKTCKKCGNKHDQKQCLKCKAAAQKAWVARNKNKYLAYQREYRKTQRGKAIQAKATTAYESTLPGMLGRLLSRALSRTKDIRKRKIEFDINKEFLLILWEKQSGKCAISGLQMDLQKKSLTCVSLDRINSRIGYIKTNVQLVCKWANLAKRDYQNELMIELVAKIRKVE
jgi:hypothetical protein